MVTVSGVDIATGEELDTKRKEALAKHLVTLFFKKTSLK
jgi:hypothetical protein